MTVSQTQLSRPILTSLYWHGRRWGTARGTDVAHKLTGWEPVSTVRESRVHVVRDETLNTPAPMLLEGLPLLAPIIRLDRFIWAFPRCFASSE